MYYRIVLEYIVPYITIAAPKKARANTNTFIFTVLNSGDRMICDSIDSLFLYHADTHLRMIIAWLTYFRTIIITSRGSVWLHGFTNGHCHGYDWPLDIGLVHGDYDWTIWSTTESNSIDKNWWTLKVVGSPLANYVTRWMFGDTINDIILFVAQGEQSITDSTIDNIF